MRTPLPTAALALALAACSLLFHAGDDPRLNEPIDFSEAGDYFLDTDLGVLTLPSARQIKLEATTESAVMIVEIQTFDLGVNSRLIATGVNALELRVKTSVLIAGIVDVAGHPGDGAPPAGSSNNLTSCGDDSINAPRLGSADGAGGGAGGSLKTNAGRGGGGGGADFVLDGDGESLGDPLGGSPQTTEPWTGSLRGGCPGGRGAIALDDATEGAALGGQGGGGIHIVSTASIVVSGQIYASGAGGQGGQGGGGGGGGGSGGVIWLSAPQITFTSSGALRANGGGGGEGSCSCQIGANGQDGSDGSSTPTDPPALGGTSPLDDQFCNCGATSLTATPAGGDGGDGSFGKFGNPRDGDNGDMGEGGGGGGGSDGYILLEADEFPSYLDGAIDPWPSDVCGELLDPAEQPGSLPCS